MASAAAGSTAAVPFWRAAGMTYITYSNICASLLRSCLKEPYKSEAASREKVHFAISSGQMENPRNPPSDLIHPNDDSAEAGWYLVSNLKLPLLFPVSLQQFAL
ncbi:hypothetical protein HPP92_021648 [Vanilla planifolia]|uniref:ATP synthase subunit epsilon, mitochondrial n=1 Tax=Vanilla planifolia TaxID=51239 RepID=A0A835UJ70_VANPL|nr:hypothetical protein HPP92_021648 [Vanilla planifolia]